MAKTKKCMRVQLMKDIRNRLQGEFKVSERELVSGSFYYNPDAVLLEDVVPFFESQYDLDLKSYNFGNWEDFIKKVAELASVKKR